ncbi:unnamed protein product [Pedinophyceae sp. YPF-701]|nr:unnamed protein product [Pedinophyceae sp. YPF-701]
METNLQLGSQRKGMKLAFKQYFAQDFEACKLLVKLAGSLESATDDYPVLRGHGEARLGRKIGRSGINLDVGAGYRPNTRAQAEDTTVFVGAQRRQRLPADVDNLFGKLRGRVTYSATKQRLFAVGTAELSKTVYNFKSGQDLRLKAGVSFASTGTVRGRGGDASLHWSPVDVTYHAKARENNWSLEMNHGTRWSWEVKYHL